MLKMMLKRQKSLTGGVSIFRKNEVFYKGRFQNFEFSIRIQFEFFKKKSHKKPYIGLKKALIINRLKKA